MRRARIGGSFPFLIFVSTFFYVGCFTQSIDEPSSNLPGRLKKQAPPSNAKGTQRSTGHMKSASTSYYSDHLAGRKTASGQLYDPKKATAAHRSLPMGTKVRVVNPENNKEVIVEVNDRGPFIKGRELDISKSAAQSLGITEDGITKLKMEVIDGNNSADDQRHRDSSK